MTPLLDGKQPLFPVSSYNHVAQLRQSLENIKNTINWLTATDFRFQVSKTLSNVHVRWCPMLFHRSRHIIRGAIDDLISTGDVHKLRDYLSDIGHNLDHGCGDNQEWTGQSSPCTCWILDLRGVQCPHPRRNHGHRSNLGESLVVILVLNRSSVTTWNRLENGRKMASSWCVGSVFKFVKVLRVRLIMALAIAAWS